MLRGAPVLRWRSQIAKFVVALGEKVAPTDIEEGMRVGVDRTKYAIQVGLFALVPGCARQGAVADGEGGRRSRCRRGSTPR